MLTHHNCSIFAIDFERTCVLTVIKEHSLKPLVTAIHLLFTTIQSSNYCYACMYRLRQRAMSQRKQRCKLEKCWDTLLVI